MGDAGNDDEGPRFNRTWSYGYNASIPERSALSSSSSSAASSPRSIEQQESALVKTASRILETAHAPSETLEFLVNVGNMFKAFIGLNFMYISFAFSKSGIIRGTIGLFLILALTEHCCLMLVQVKNSLHQKNVPLHESQEVKETSDGRWNRASSLDRVEPNGNDPSSANRTSSLPDIPAASSSSVPNEERTTRHVHYQASEITPASSASPTRNDPHSLRPKLTLASSSSPSSLQQTHSHGRSMVEQLSVGDVARLAVGPNMERFVNTMLVITQFGFCVGYLIFISSTLHDLVESNMHIYWYILIPTPVLIILVMLRSVRSLALFSNLANVSLLTGFIAVITYISIHFKWQPTSPSILSFPLFVGQCSSAIEGTGLVLPIETGMKDPSKFPIVLRLALILMGSVLFPVGILGFAVFGEDTKSIILLNMEGTTILRLIKAVLVIGILFTYPLQLTPVLVAMEDWLKGADPTQRTLRSSTHDVEMQPMTSEKAVIGLENKEDAAFALENPLLGEGNGVAETDTDDDYSASSLLQKQVSNRVISKDTNGIGVATKVEKRKIRLSNSDLEMGQHSARTSGNISPRTTKPPAVAPSSAAGWKKTASTSDSEPLPPKWKRLPPTSHSRTTPPAPNETAPTLLHTAAVRKERIETPMPVVVSADEPLSMHVDTSALPVSAVGQHKHHSLFVTNPVSIVGRLLIVLTTVLVATFAGASFGNFMSLIGSLGAATLAYTIPSVMHLYAFWNQLSKWTKAKDFAILSFGILAAVLGTVISIFEMVRSEGKLPG